MLTPAARLRSLVKEATPGPWRVEVNQPWEEATVEAGSFPLHVCRTDGRRNTHYSGDARLISLAPQLAELVADMGDAAQACLDSAEQEPFDALEAVLRRFASLFPEDSA